MSLFMSVADPIYPTYLQHLLAPRPLGEILLKKLSLQRFLDRMASAAANEGGSATVSAADIPTNEEDLDVFVKELMENSEYINLFYLVDFVVVVLLLQLTYIHPNLFSISLYINNSGKLYYLQMISDGVCIQNE